MCIYLLFVFLYVQQRTDDSLEEFVLSFHNVEPTLLALFGGTFKELVQNA